VSALPRALYRWVPLIGLLGMTATLRAQNLSLDLKIPYRLRSNQGSQSSLMLESYPETHRSAVQKELLSNYSLAGGMRQPKCAHLPITCARTEAADLILTSRQTTRSSSAPGSSSAISSGAEERNVSWKLIIPNFLSDQKHIWLFPIHVMEGQHLRPTVATIGVTAGLIALDPHTTPYFRHHNNFAQFNDIFKVTTTERVFLGLPVLYYFFGLARRNSYAQQTAFFAAESIVDVDLLAGVMRSIDGRLHPRDIPPNGDYTHTWFKAKGTYLNRGSFPSGHTAGAFAVATIFAERYGRRHRWVPWVAYPLAALTGVSRITDSAHFPSDVFMGGLLAYTISRYVVLREH
jgi:membrane-associated PAP2 superfamily phosphatase